MFAIVLLSNVLHGAIALLWMAGARRLLSLAPELASRLYALALGIPPLVAVLHFVMPNGSPSERWAVLRVDAWWISLQATELPLAGLGELLLAGTTLLFLIQEVAPALRGRPAWHAIRQADPSLDQALARVIEAFRSAGLLSRRVPRLAIARLDEERPLATLSGLVRPCILISRGLLLRLDTDELDGVIAHEFAHALRGGNLWVFCLWALRALQGPSPAALIAFRQLLETEELACDALAARATRKPACLARALLEVTQDQAAGLDREAPLVRVRQRGQLLAIRFRVRRLLDGPQQESVGSAVLPLAAVLLSCLLWLVR